MVKLQFLVNITNFLCYDLRLTSINYLPSILLSDGNKLELEETR